MSSNVTTKQQVNTKTPAGSIYELAIHDRYTGKQFSIEYVRASSRKAAIAKLEMRIENSGEDSDYYPISYWIEA